MPTWMFARSGPESPADSDLVIDLERVLYIRRDGDNPVFVLDGGIEVPVHDPAWAGLTRILGNVAQGG